jgi:hypothetical protein
MGYTTLSSLCPGVTAATLAVLFVFAPAGGGAAAETDEGAVVPMASVASAGDTSVAADARMDDPVITERAASVPIVKVSFGFKAGLGLSQHTGTMERDAEYAVSSRWRTGFTAGAFLYLPVTRRFGLQQEVLYVQKGSRQGITVDILDIPTVLDVTYKMDYIEIPVLLRFAWFRSARNMLYSFAGTALAIKVHDRYTLTGAVDDGSERVPISADADMSEVDMFDYSFVYGFGWERVMGRFRLVFEYRFTIGWNTLLVPTYAYVPFGDEELLIDNEPVPLKNQNHCILMGITF